MKKSTKMKKYTKKTNRKRISKKQYRNKKSRIVKQKGGEGKYDKISDILYGYDASQNNYEAIKEELSGVIKIMTNEELIEMIPEVLPIFINDTIGNTGNTIDDNTRKQLFIECVKAKVGSNEVLGEIEYEIEKAIKEANHQVGINRVSARGTTIRRTGAIKRHKGSRKQTGIRPTHSQRMKLLEAAKIELEQPPQSRRPPTREQQEMLLKTALAELRGNNNEQTEFNNRVINGQRITSRNLRQNRTMNSTGHSRV
jgi:hypothetical protein